MDYTKEKCGVDRFDQAYQIQISASFQQGGKIVSFAYLK